MTRIGTYPSVRYSLAFVLAAIVLSGFASPARAVGCRAPERPVLGLSSPFDVLGPIAAVSFDKPERLSPLLETAPCSGETFGDLARTLSAAPALRLDPFTSLEDGRSTWISGVHLLTPPRPFLLGLERPPRIAAIVA